MNKSTTTIRIYRESHSKLSEFLQKNGLKSVRAVSTALARLVEERPDFFIPKIMHKHNNLSFPSERNLNNEDRA